MKFLVNIAALVLLSGCGPSPEQQALDAAVTNSIKPWHQEFVAATRDLAGTAHKYCAISEPLLTVGARQMLQQSWREAMLSWAQLQLVQFGPVLKDNKNWKLQFWPDKKNLVRKKVEQVLADPGAINADRIGRASAVAQGLSALEYLLFDPAAWAEPKTDIQRQQRMCDYIVAASQRSAWIARYLSRDWFEAENDYAQAFLNPGAENLHFSDHKQAIAMMLDALVANLEIIKNRKLAAPLGLHNSLQLGNGYLLEAWRSKYSLALLKQSLQASYQFYKFGGLAQYLQQTDNNAQQGVVLEQDIDILFKQSLDQVQALKGELFTGVTDPEQRLQLSKLHDQLAALIKPLKHQVPDHLGVTLGFNANDGD